jgi:chloride channel protein, CIC family
MTEPDPNEGRHPWAELVGPVTDARRPQVLFSDEILEQALRQLVLYGHAGLPVLSRDGKHLSGWLTRRGVLRALGEQLGSEVREAEMGTLASRFAEEDPASGLHEPSTPLQGYEMVEITLEPGCPAVGRRIEEIAWPRDCILVAVTDAHEISVPRADLELRPGERVILLAPVAGGDAAAPGS